MVTLSRKRPLTIIAVDPGHATRVDAVRYHPDGVQIEPLPIDASRRQKRRHHLQQKLGSNDPKELFFDQCTLAGCLWPTDSQTSNATLDVEDGAPASN